MTGTFYIVPTPIGNLEDISARALRVLREVDLIAAEDTRHSRKLLNHFGITTPLVSYFREKEQQKSEELLSQLQEGKNLALISDAGTPAISDPGAVLVQKAHQLGIPVVPLPGPCALTTAMSASGSDHQGFLFLGFLPGKTMQRQKAIAAFADSRYPVVLYESPHRVEGLLEDALAVLGERQALWARELSKAYEEIALQTLSDLVAKAKNDRNRGEFVLVIFPGEQEEVTGQTVEDLLAWYRDNTTLSMKDVSRKLASDLGLSRSQVYQLALELWKDKKK